MSFTHSTGMGRHAMNCLQMVGGYSPCYLDFGRNPRLPSVMNDLLTALEGTTLREILHKPLNASHTGHWPFILAEISETIRQALRHQVGSSGRIFRMEN